MTSTDPFGGVTGPPSGGKPKKKKPTDLGYWGDPNYGYTQTTPPAGKKTLKYRNPAGLGEVIGRTQIDGAAEYFSDNASGGSGVGGLPLAQKVTADQAAYLFADASAAKIAETQQQLYLAGLYPSTYKPTFGIYTAEDGKAFRQLLIGLAANPDQADLKTYLQGTASAGAATGLTHHTPLVAKLTNPQDIQQAAQKAALSLNGTYMDPGQLAAFTTAYQAQERDYQTSAYAATGFNPATGQQDPGFAPSASGQPGEVTQPPSPDTEAANVIRYTNPGGVAINEFKAAFEPALLAAGRSTVPVGGVGT